MVKNGYSKFIFTNQGHQRRVRLLEKATPVNPTTTVKRPKQARPPQYPPPYRSRDFRHFDRDYNDLGSDDDVTVPLNVKQQKEGVIMCTTQKQVRHHIVNLLSTCQLLTFWGYFLGLNFRTYLKKVSKLINRISIYVTEGRLR